MANIKSSYRKWLRQILGPTLREMSRSGKILQTLWGASQIQSQQRDYYRRVGELAVMMTREGKIQNIEIERIAAKIDRCERILRRQEITLKIYSDRSDLRDSETEDRQDGKDRLEAV